MPIFNLLRYISGTVKFKITGPFPQRVIDMCKNSKIPLWNLKPCKNGYTANTYSFYLNKLKNNLKGRYTIKLEQKYGLPLKLNKIKNKYGVILGIALTAVMIVFLISRIWIIDIKCSDDFESFRIMSALSKIGIEPGIKRSRLNARDLQTKLLLEDDSLAWDSINIKGCKIEIEVSLKKSPPERRKEKGRFADLIAERDGQIIYSQISSGQTLFTTGNTVKKGEVLVSGTMKDKYQHIKCVYSKGIVKALCREEIKIEVPLEKKILSPVNKAFYKVTVSAFGKDLPILKGQTKSESVRISQKLYFLPFFKNISIKSELFQPVKYISITLNEDDALKEAKRILEKEIAKLNAEKIISKEMVQSKNNDTFFINSELTFIKDIAVTREF